MTEEEHESSEPPSVQSVICTIAGAWGKLDSPATWSHPDSSEPVTADRNCGIKMGEHEMSKSRTSGLYCKSQRRPSQTSLAF